ncbi:hypothetical protein BHUM_02044c [Candidatus Burkholderia humilis]|nr:hypothetical protein BHUM_02044c [Candidatus Burkholderia humilis]
MNLSRKRLMIAVALAVLLVLAALALTYRARKVTTERSDWVVEQWCHAMHRYNINPVYPPTEDFHVGDIIGFSADAVEGESSTCPLFGAVKVAYVPMRDELEKYYQNVAVFPETAPPPKEDGALWRQLPAGASCDDTTCSGPANGLESVFKDAGPTTHLPIVAFPGLTLRSETSSGVSSALPARIAEFLFGASGSANDSVTIKIRSAQTYGVPAAVALDALRRHCDVHKRTAFDCLNNDVIQELASLRGKQSKTTNVSLVYRVYLIRSIEYTLNASSAVGAEAKALIDGALEKQSASSDQETAPSKADTETAASETEADRQRRMRALTTNVTGKTIPGGTFTATASSNGSITLVETFVRLIAIGYRSVSMLSVSE